MSIENNVRNSMNVAKLTAPSIVSILLNDTCNLKCQTCYLENMNESNPLNRQEWNSAFRSLFGDLKPNAVVFVGKEVFAQNQSVDIMFDALETRDSLQTPRETDIGVITNGTLLHNYRSRLENSSLDWIDISIDGSREFNDRIRGQGSYSKLERNLGWISKAFQDDRLWVVPTLCDSNVSIMASMIQGLNLKYRISNYSIGLYKSRSSAPDFFSVGAKEVSRLFDDLNKIQTKSPINVVFSYASDNPDIYSPLFSIPDSNGETITTKDIDLDNGIKLKIQRNNRKMGLWRAIRVSSEGDWLAAEDLFDHQHYKQNAVTNLRGVNYDTRKAYEIGLQSPRAKSLGFVLLPINSSQT